METPEGIETRPETGDFSGLNRTGIMSNRSLSAELIEGAEETLPNPDGDASELAASRAEYVQDALPIGSLPTPVSNSEAEDKEPLVQQGLALLLDKLGERLAFERQGTRLYEAFVQKLETTRFGETAGPSIEEARHICEEELEHFKLLQTAISEIGGDATVQTPSADIAGVLSHGIMQIVSDPRSTMPQMLQALLTAELADNEGWQLLEQLLKEAGQSELAQQCQSAIEQEKEHLENVRAWLTDVSLTELKEMTGEFSSEAEENVSLSAPRADQHAEQAEEEPSDALSLLKADHERVKELFDRAEKADEKQQKKLFKEIKKELERHTRIEESVFYPNLEKREELKEMMLESLEEHKQIKTLLREIEKLRGESEKFEPKLKLLRENVSHHAEEEEEGKMFPKIRRLLSASELKEMAAELETAKGKGRKKQR